MIKYMIPIAISELLKHRYFMLMIPKPSNVSNEKLCYQCMC